MSIEAIKEALPSYAKDLKLNLSNILNSTVLTEQQLWGTLVASAFTSPDSNVRKAIAAEAKNHLSPEAFAAAKAAAAIMAMNNVYYRFIHLVSDKEYANMPAQLRMSVIANPGVEKNDFELWALAVSAINGCGACIDSHEHHLSKEGLSREMIQHAIRIASVIYAVAETLASESDMKD